MKGGKIGEFTSVVSILSLKNKAKSLVEDGEESREKSDLRRVKKYLQLFLLVHPPFTLLLIVTSLGNHLSPFLVYGLEIELTQVSPPLPIPMTPTTDLDPAVGMSKVWPTEAFITLALVFASTQ